ncbi:MAG: D-alanine--D-alanine ligase [Candidatus Theseobacter exili]|nr:D-alanine--D-alanine ligase [Candidatus Theseobacter exili]
MRKDPFKKVGVILGGKSRERDVSIRSGKAIADALREKGIEVVEIGEKCSIESGILNSNIDVAFIALHGRFGEDGEIQKFLESHQIPYTGSGPEASQSAMNKVTAKKIFEREGISTPSWHLIKKNKPYCFEDIFLPSVVKPALEGSSIGLSIVHDKDSFSEALEKAFSMGDEVIVEQFIPGKEVTVSILGNKPLPVVQIETDRVFYDFTAKYHDHSTQYLVPAPLEEQIKERVQRLGLVSHNALGCRDFSRVDIIIGENGRPYVLEVNTIPGFTQTSLLPKAACAAGIDFAALCLRILDLCHNRKQSNNPM